MRLCTIRHGESFVNLPDWDGTNFDQGLTGLGKAQAEKVAMWLPALFPEVKAIYGSSMIRVRETVAPLATVYGISPTFEDALREIGTNRWNHVAFSNDEMPTWPGGFWASEQPFVAIGEEGESLMHFRIRVGRFIEALRARHQGETVLVVSHGGVVESIFDHVFNIGPWRRCEIKTQNTAVTLFEYVELPGRGTWRLHFHNRVDHLQS